MEMYLRATPFLRGFPGCFFWACSSQPFSFSRHEYFGHGPLVGQHHISVNHHVYHCNDREYVVLACLLASYESFLRNS